LERIEELKKQKEQVKSRDEFKRILRAIAKNEDEIIKTKQKITLLEAEVETLEEAYKKVREDVAPQAAVLKDKLDEVGKEIAFLERKLQRVRKEIERIKERVPSKELEEFERLKRKFNGLVFADVSTGACEGCGMTFSPAEYKELLKSLEPGKSKCPYCGRFIYSKALAKS
jgi:predicted  nucleic acid-binding Zn-ribbon protein